MTDESLEQVVMAIDLRERGTLGCAYYVAREERLYCMEDVANGGMEIVERRRYVSKSVIECTDNTQ